MTLVSGQMLDHAGQPMPGMVVYATPVGGRRFVPSPMTSTDLSGRWAFDLGSGDWRIREVGFASHQITVGENPVRLGEADTQAATAPDPTTEDIERLLVRHKQVRAAEQDAEQEEFSPRDERDVHPLPSEGRPIVESPVTRIGDVASFLRERRGE